MSRCSRLAEDSSGQSRESLALPSFAPVAGKAQLSNGLARVEEGPSGRALPESAVRPRIRCYGCGTCQRKVGNTPPSRSRVTNTSAGAYLWYVFRTSPSVAARSEPGLS